MFRFAQHDSATCEPERDARQKRVMRNLKRRGLFADADENY